MFNASGPAENVCSTQLVKSSIKKRGKKNIPLAKPSAGALA